MYNEKLVNEKKKFGKSQENYKDELNDKLKKKNEILSKINIQYEKIQRLMGELKFEKKKQGFEVMYYNVCDIF